jgi:hypothetical protein
MQRIAEFYADNAEVLMADEPIELLAGEGVSSRAAQLARRAARDHAVELELGRYGADEFVNKKLIRIGRRRARALQRRCQRH